MSAAPKTPTNSQQGGASRWPYHALLASAFFMGFTMPAARLFMAIALVGLIVDLMRRRRVWRMPLSGWLWIALVVLAGVVTYYGINPGKGMSKLTKLLWFIGIPVATSLIDSRQQMWQVIRALVYGTAVAGGRVLLRNLIGAGAIVTRLGDFPAIEKTSFAQELIYQGGLSDGQRLMVGLIGAITLIMGGAIRRGPHWLRLRLEADSSAPTAVKTSLRLPIWPLLLTIIALGEIVVLKRGSWLSALAVLALLLFRRIRWYWLPATAIVLAALVLSVTPIRQRVAHISSEFKVESGGRLAMWTKVAPPLLRQYPQGIGYRAMTSGLMRTHYRQVEPNRDHLHSNFVEMAVSLGWAGLLLYLIWMGFMLRDAWLSDLAPSPAFWMLLALFLNGVVEYNFGDGAIVVIYGLLGGVAAAGRRVYDKPPHLKEN